MIVVVFQARFKGKSALTGSYILQNSENGPVCPPPVQAAAAQAPSLVQPTTANAYLGYFPSSYGYGFAEQVRTVNNLSLIKTSCRYGKSSFCCCFMLSGTVNNWLKDA